MKRFLKLAAVAAASLVVLGCGTVNLNKVITGTDCATREECVKALNLKNPEKADLTFVVKPYEFNVGFKTGWGYTQPGTKRRFGDAAYCVAKALRQEFANSRILVDDKHGDRDIFVAIHDIRIGVNWNSGDCRMKAAVMINGKKYDIKGHGAQGAFRVTDDAIFYPAACADIAKQVKKLIDENKTVIGMAGN